MQGLADGPRFERIRIPTIDESFVGRVQAVFCRPRVRMIEELRVPMPQGPDVIIPEGFESDGGSVPLFALWVLVVIGSVLGGWWLVASTLMLLHGLMLNSFGLMLSCFLLHDFAVRYRRLILADDTTMEVRSVWHANTLMRRSVYSVNDMLYLGAVAHIAVTVGAWNAWRKHRNNDADGINDVSVFTGEGGV